MIAQFAQSDEKMNIDKSPVYKLPFSAMYSIFDQIKIDDTYELLFPKRVQGMAIIWLYEKVKNGYFDKGIFKEKDIQQAFDTVDSLNRGKRERNPWEYYNSQIMALQEFYLLYDEEQQTYQFKDYATYLCDKVFKMLSDRFNPTVIEVICTDLFEKLNKATSENELSTWLDVHFDKDKAHLKEQIDYLNQQIDKSVAELSEKAKLKTDSLLTALRDIENKLDEIRKQNGELRGAFREIDKIKSMLIIHPARENVHIDEKVSVAIDYFEGVRTSLNMIDSRIDKIQPKIQQFFGSLNRRRFDTKVEKFLLYLLDKSRIVSGELQLPVANESFIARFPTSNFTTIESWDELFPRKNNQRIVYVRNAEKEAVAHQQSHKALFRQNQIGIWLDKIKREVLQLQEYHLSDIFFKILEEHNEDLHLAVSVIYQTISLYDKHNSWHIAINTEKKIQQKKYNYEIWDIWMIRK
jgi:hypothetical protein